MSVIHSEVASNAVTFKTCVIVLLICPLALDGRGVGERVESIANRFDVAPSLSVSPPRGERERYVSS